MRNERHLGDAQYSVRYCSYCSPEETAADTQDPFRSTDGTHTIDVDGQNGVVTITLRTALADSIWTLAFTLGLGEATHLGLALQSEAVKAEQH